MTARIIPLYAKLAPVPVEDDLRPALAKSYTLNLRWRDVELRTVIRREWKLARRALEAARETPDAEGRALALRIVRHHRANARAMTRMLRPVVL